MRHGRLALGAIQLAGTLLTMTLMPWNLATAATLAGWWALTFRRLSRVEWMLFAGGCALFTGLDLMAVRQGAFAFNRPDMFGLPWWEPLMWGFYLVHARRMVGDMERGERRRPGPALALALIFAAAFMAAPDSEVRLLTTTVALAGALCLFHSRRDLLGAGYMVLLGAAVEYAGVWSGQWSYADAPAGGVPLWFATMWGAVGLFLGRLAALLPQGEVVGARRGVGLDLDDEALGDERTQIARGSLS